MSVGAMAQKKARGEKGDGCGLVRRGQCKGDVHNNGADTQYYLHAEQADDYVGSPLKKSRGVTSFREEHQGQTHHGEGEKAMLEVHRNGVVEKIYQGWLHRQQSRRQPVAKHLGEGIRYVTRLKAGDETAAGDL